MFEGGGTVAAKLRQLTAHTSNLPPSMLVSATYNGEQAVAVLKFYEPSGQRIYLWYDRTGHRPYCYTLLGLEETRARLRGFMDLRFQEEEKYDLLEDRPRRVTKIVAPDPLTIGGGKKSVRNDIEAWEADIKYYENYLYDNNLHVGAFYRIVDDVIQPVPYELPQEVGRVLEELLQENERELRDYIKEWAVLLNQPLLNFKRLALDIEVDAGGLNRVPDTAEAKERVLAIGLVGSDGRKEVLLLRRERPLGEKGGLEASVIPFEDEREMLLSAFERMMEYPFVVTFNGDDFDLNYLYHRALRLGIHREAIPITMGRDYAALAHGVHIDLYRTFVNRSIQNYAFGRRYTEHTLEGVAEGLLGEGKLEYEGRLEDLPLLSLAQYCYRDAQLTYQLTSFDDEVLLKLLTVIARIAKLPIDDVARLGVSQWIRSMMYMAHRRQGYLIPRKDDLARKGGASSEAVIRGKKYKGALVVEPKSGVHFNVKVLDFASLYPSIIKVFNLSYETVRCPHPECRANVIHETDHWVCTKRRGITSLLIGSLRDLRVKYYKHLAKSPGLSRVERSFYSVISQGLKVILNAAYGVFGFEEFPLYCLPVADATAAIGRYIISRTIEQCGTLGVEVVYGDTDSLFIKSPAEEPVERIRSWAEAELRVELELDKVYKYAAFSGRKKNYFGVLPDGSVDIKGLTGKKSHTPLFIKKLFQQALQYLGEVNTPEDFMKARERTKELLREGYLQLKERKVPLEELAFRVMLGKNPEEYAETTPQHIKAARLLQERGKEVKAGDIIYFVKVMGPLGVKPLELTRKEEVDVDKYVEFLKGTFEQVLDALGYDFEELMGARRLEEFFVS
ncbi:MAG: DNA mismatch repair protein MutH [Nitrososphaerota archaeon]